MVRNRVDGIDYENESRLTIQQVFLPHLFVVAQARLPCLADGRFTHAGANRAEREMSKATSPLMRMLREMKLNNGRKIRNQKFGVTDIISIFNTLYLLTRSYLAPLFINT